MGASIRIGDDDMRLKSVLFLALVATVLVLVPSCGGGSKAPEPTPAPTAAPTEAQAPASQLPSGHPPISGAPTPAGAIESPAQAPAGKLPPGHPPVAGARTPLGSIVPPAPGAGVGSAAVVWSSPKEWVEEPPSSAMRKAQYKVPGPGGDGECIVFYFGPGQGGDAMSNARRWASQFKKADGSPATDQLKTSESQVGDLKVLEAEVTGTYASGMSMGMASAEEKPGYMLLGAIAEGPDSNWFFKLTGPAETVRAQRAAFEQMVKSLKKGA
jgi:hypothetical protein